MAKLAAALLVCFAISLPAVARGSGSKARRAGSGSSAIALDHAAMQATGCVLTAADLKPMPTHIGSARLGDAADKLKLIFSARLRATAQAAPAHCSGMKPAFFVQGKGNGSVKWATVAMVVKPLDVWRVWSDRPAFCSQATRDGRWWSLSDPRPIGKAAYRKRNGICESWNNLTHLVHCVLKPGTPVAIGPTESVTKKRCSCSKADRVKWGDKVADAYDPALPKYAAHDHASHVAPTVYSYDEDDSTLQVFVNTKGQLGKLTSHCEDFSW